MRQRTHHHLHWSPRECGTGSTAKGHFGPCIRVTPRVNHRNSPPLRHAESLNFRKFQGIIEPSKCLSWPLFWFPFFFHNTNQIWEVSAKGAHRLDIWYPISTCLHLVTLDKHRSGNQTCQWEIPKKMKVFDGKIMSIWIFHRNVWRRVNAKFLKTQS